MLVLLDRDGVINEDLPNGVTRPEELRMIPGSLEAVATLTHAGFRIALVTNQSGVAKGFLTQDTLDAIHAQLRSGIERAGGRLDAVYVCTDHPDHPTHRRKPAPGMLLEALYDFSADAATTPLIGDALRDMEAAAAAGCPRILAKTGQGHFTLNKGLPDHVKPVTVCENLAEAATLIIQRYGRQAVPCHFSKH